jgi:beta-phosphoglucomutase
MLPIIILDFDGVILESVSVKTEAFRTLFSFAPEYVGEIEQFHRYNGGMSRFDKFRYIYDHILKRELNPDTFNTLSEKFSALVFQGVVNAPFVPGAKEFLKQWCAKIPLYIVSATPEPELMDIVQKRNIKSFFRKVYGSPRKKTDCIREILTESGTPANEVLFIGDAKNDLEAARATGVRFIGRVAAGEKNVFRNCKGVEKVIKDLNELSGFLEEIA